MPAFLDRAAAPRLAHEHRIGTGPTLVFLPGFMSDMRGTKAQWLDDWAAARGKPLLRFDYSGCGESGGAFDDATIAVWRDDALAVIDGVAPGPLVLIGSSMGGWLALLAALARPERVAAIVLIAAAPDFTRWGVAPTRAERVALEDDGRFERPSAYGGTTIYTQALIRSGEQCALLDGEIGLDCPVRLLHGQADPDVPWRLSLEIAARLRSADVQVTLIKDGDHRLSRPADLALLGRLLGQLLEGLAP